MTEAETLAQGHEVERDPSTGQFLHTHLSSDRARNMRLAQMNRQATASEEAAFELLAGLGIQQEDAAPHLLALAKAVNKGGSGLATNLTTLLRLAGFGQADGKMAKPGPDEKCSLCGRGGPGFISAEVALQIAEVAALYAEQLHKTPKVIFADKPSKPKSAKPGEQAEK